MSTALSAVVLLAVVAVAGFLFLRRAHLLYRVVRLGKPAGRTGEVGRRARAEATIVLGQRKLLQRLGPGLMHAFIFWGFLVLFPTIVMAFLAAVDRDWTLPWLGHQGWFFLVVDVFCMLVLVGVAAGFLIRKVQRPARFEGSHLGEADLILAMGPHHLERIEALGGGGKAHLLSEFASHGASSRPISDPIGAELDVYRATADELEEEIRRVVDRITAERSSGAG